MDTLACYNPGALALHFCKKITYSNILLVLLCLSDPQPELLEKSGRNKSNSVF